MKILLVAVNAKYIHSNPAIYSLAAYAKTYQAIPEECLELAEYTINHSVSDILQDLYERKPDVLCFSCYIWNYDYVRELAAEFHKLRPDVPIWLGGPEASYEVETAFAENPSIFGVMIGEGEATFAELAAYYCGGMQTDLAGISGIAYRIQPEEEGRTFLRRTKPRALLALDDIPFYYADADAFSNRIVYYESSRGCPFSCSYCLSSIEKKLRLRSMELVKQELLFFLEQKAPQVKFVDRTFNCNHAHAMEIWKWICEQDRGVTNFHFEIAADLLTEEEIAFLSTLRPGLVQFEIGVQSTNPETLRAIRRTGCASRIFSAAERLLQAGNIHLHLDLIAGLPYEGYDRFTESFREVYARKPHQLQLGFLKLLKGSDLYERRDDYGILCRDRPPYEVMQTRWLSYDELLRIKLAEQMLEAYYNSGQYEVTMKLMDAVYPDAFAFFLALGRFYQKNGQMGMRHSRIRRAQLLLAFVREEKGAPLEWLEESLLYDLYYRENIKSRPEWAKNPAAWKNVTRTFCRRGTLSHIEPFFYEFPKASEKTVKQLPERLKEPVWTLFDYERRDALTHQAHTIQYTNEEVMRHCENVQRKF